MSYPTIRPDTKVAIVGSRDYPDLEAVMEFVDSLPESCTIISGGAKGVDATALRTAQSRRMAIQIFKPDYEAFKGREKAAPLARNTDIVNACDVLIAFTFNNSKGTADALKKAQARHRKEWAGWGTFNYHEVPACFNCRRAVWSEYGCWIDGVQKVGCKGCVLVAEHQDKEKKKALKAQEALAQ